MAKSKQKQSGGKFRKPTNVRSNTRGPVELPDDENSVKYRVSKGRGEERTRIDSSHRFNDVSWYAKNDQMLRDAASVSYNSPLGLTLPYDLLFPSGSPVASTPTSVPGLYSMRYVICPGISINSSSPANLAAQNIYSFVRYMNSGAKNYDQADLMLYLLAMDSVYMMWNWAKRIYGYARTYSQKNRYMPRVFAGADAVNFDSVIQNLADFRLQLNSLAAQISSFCVPAVMPIFIRHSWMASNIYMDSDVDKAQMYMFSPDVYYIYDETGSSFGGRLVARKLKNTGATNSMYSYLDICTLIKDALDAVAYSEDIGVMSGDILKAYGQDKLFKISPIEPDYMVTPVYNEEVLSQIHNSRMSPLLDDYSQLNIVQDPNSGYLVWNPTLKKDVMQVGAVMINMPWNDVTPANTMVGTRLTSMQREDDKFICVGTEFISDRVLFTLQPNGFLNFLHIGNYLAANFSGSEDDATNFAHAMQAASLVSQFDWHPLMLCVGVDTHEDIYKYNIYGYEGDVSNYTIIDAYTMEQIHLTAILSEFNVPQLGSF